MNSRHIQKITVITLLSFLVINCSSYRVRYNRHNLLNKYGATHQFYLNENKIDLDTLILDSRNIKSVIRDRGRSTIRIIENESRNFNSIQKLVLAYDSNNSYSDVLIVVNGIPISRDFKHLWIDSLAIKSIKVLKYRDLIHLNLCSATQNVILVTTL
ncbi:MAG: hypothetical protein WBG46_03320 [Nonlabens sp.]